MTLNAQIKTEGAQVEIHKVSSSLFKLLLDRLKVSVEEGILIKAIDKVTADFPDIRPVEFIRLVLKAAQLVNIQVAQIRWGRFDLRRLPVLIFNNDGCYLVETGPARDQVQLTNANGDVSTSAIDVLEDAIVIWLKPMQTKMSSDNQKKGNIAARMVFSELFKTKRWLVDVLLATVVVNVLAIATSIYAMQTYDRVVPTLAYATLTTMVVGMMIIISIDWVLKIIRAKIIDHVSCAVDKAVSQKVFDHVMHLQLDVRPRSLGTLSAQVSGLDSVRQFFSSVVIFSLIDMPFALMFIFFIYIIGGSVSFVYLALLPIAILLGWTTQIRLRRLLKEQMIRINERQGLLVDAIRGTESIRACNATWRFSEEWQSITHSINQYNIRQKAISNFSIVTTGSLSTLAYVIAIVVGVGQIESGNLTMGGMIACSILGSRVIAPISRAIQQLAQWQQVSQALQMVNQVLLLNKERSDDQQLLMPEEMPDTIELESVRFSYGESPVLQLDIPQLRFSAGDRVVLLGPVGSGKSTLLKILAGMYKPSEGRVRLGQADLWETDPNIVSNAVSYLPQNVCLFKGTLQSNLALSGAVNDSRLLQVAKDLGVDQIAAASSLNMGLEISEGGEGLSDGQRQLVGLARLFLAQPRIWLLDEPMSALDAESEQRVLKAIETYVKPEDILIISTHRPMLANQIANRVILLQQGKVVMDGPPEKILPKLMGNPSAGTQHKKSIVDTKKGPGGLDVI